MIGTLPIKPHDKTNIGMLIAPTIMDYVGSVLNIRKVMGINTLNTYVPKDAQKEVYLNSIGENYISYDSLFVDGDYASLLLNEVDKLYHSGRLKVDKKEVIRCDCGRVDVLRNSIRGDSKLYEVIDGKRCCKVCGKVCKIYKEWVLVLVLDKDIDDSVSIVPGTLKNEVMGFSRVFKGSELLVSKSRDTDFSIGTTSGKFNIDIDFLWMNLFNLFPEDNQILIASNHQLLIMYLINYISKMSSCKKLHFIANPYVNPCAVTSNDNIMTTLSDVMDRYDSKDLMSYKKLFILYSLTWKRKNCVWSKETYKFLKNMSDSEIDNLYNITLERSRNFLKQYGDIDILVNQILSSGTSRHESIKEMKGKSLSIK